MASLPRSVASTSPIVATYDYSPFGQLIATSGTPELSPLGFSSEVFDPETALTYYNYRYYNPTDGCWLARDPAGESASLNLYAFVNNAPTYRTDYLGLEKSMLDILDFSWLFGNNDEIMSEGECCKMAKRKGFAENAGGKVICCDGRKMACNFVWSEDWGMYASEEAEKIVEKCLTDHELGHLLYGKACPCRRGISRSYPEEPTKNAYANSEGYLGCKEIKCLKSEISQCDKYYGSKQIVCRQAVQTRIDLLINDKSKYGSVYLNC